MGIEGEIPKARKLAHWAAYRYRQQFDDTLSDALYGLAEAGARCQPGRPLGPYAERYMWGAIRRGIRVRHSRADSRHGMPRPSGPRQPLPERQFVSLDAPTPRTDTKIGPLADVVAGPEPSPEQQLQSKELWATVGRVLAPRENLLVRLYFQWDLSQDQIASLLGVSQMQISRLLKQSLQALRAQLT